MSVHWYYSHDGVTQGPFSEEEINNLIAAKMLLETDLLWPEGKVQKDAARASAIFDFPPLPVASSPMPDWLADVAQAESKRPLSESLPSHEIPAWLDDLRLWVGLELYIPSVKSTPSKPGQAGEIPDWLQGWVPPEMPAACPAPPPLIPIALPAPPVTPPPTIAPSPPESKQAPQKTANPLVEKVLQSSGFDLETGQILDPEKFAKWKQQQAQSTPVSNASLLEVFRKARLAIEAWTDDEVNHDCIMQTEVEEIKRYPEIQALIHEYANYGQGMQEKLLRHLEFMVENRRKYYHAMEQRRSS